MLLTSTSVVVFVAAVISFGRCVKSDVRDDQCHVLEPTELLKVRKSLLIKRLGNTVYTLNLQWTTGHLSYCMV